MMDLLDASPPRSVSRAYSCGTTKLVSHPPGPLFLWPPIIQKPSLDFPTEWQLGSMREEEEAASPFKACASRSLKYHSQLSLLVKTCHKVCPGPEEGKQAPSVDGRHCMCVKEWEELMEAIFVWCLSCLPIPFHLLKFQNTLLSYFT